MKHNMKEKKFKLALKHTYFRLEAFSSIESTSSQKDMKLDGWSFKSSFVRSMWNGTPPPSLHTKNGFHRSCCSSISILRFISSDSDWGNTVLSFCEVCMHFTFPKFWKKTEPNYCISVSIFLRMRSYEDSSTDPAN